MPTYEFRCPNGHEFTRFYKTISGAAMQLPCTDCGAVAERQLSGGAGLLFKGSGFYLTDYGKNAHRKSDGGRQTADGGEKKGDAKAPADSGTKSEPATTKAESRELKAESRKAESREDKAESPKKAKAESPKSE